MSVCQTCYDLPHRRPRGGLCACGGAYADELIERPEVALQSSAARWQDEPVSAAEDVREMRRVLGAWRKRGAR